MLHRWIQDLVSPDSLRIIESNIGRPLESCRSVAGLYEFAHSSTDFIGQFIPVVQPRTIVTSGTKGLAFQVLKKIDYAHRRSVHVFEHACLTPMEFIHHHQNRTQAAQELTALAVV